jgi:hypothetical protein
MPVVVVSGVIRFGLDVRREDEPASFAPTPCAKVKLLDERASTVASMIVVNFITSSFVIEG